MLTKINEMPGFKTQTSSSDSWNRALFLLAMPLRKSQNLVKAGGQRYIIFCKDDLRPEKIANFVRNVLYYFFLSRKRDVFGFL